MTNKKKSTPRPATTSTATNTLPVVNPAPPNPNPSPIAATTATATTATPATSATNKANAITLKKADRDIIYNFLHTLVKKNKNRATSIQALLDKTELEMKDIIMYKYLITDSFNSKDYDTVQACYKKLSDSFSPNSKINRYIYSLICYIDVEREFYKERNQKITLKLNINMNQINNLFKKSNPSVKTSTANPAANPTAATVPV